MAGTVVLQTNPVAMSSIVSTSCDKSGFSALTDKGNIKDYLPDAELPLWYGTSLYKVNIKAKVIAGPQGKNILNIFEINNPVEIDGKTWISYVKRGGYN